MSTTITFVGGKGDQNLNLVVSEDIEQVQEALVAAHGLGAAGRRRLGQRERVRRARLPPRTEGPSRLQDGRGGVVRVGDVGIHRTRRGGLEALVEAAMNKQGDIPMSNARPTDPIGSITWTERTGGVLTARECVSLAGPLVRGELRILSGRLAMAL